MRAAVPTATSANSRFAVVLATMAAVPLSSCLLLFDSGGDEPPSSGAAPSISGTDTTSEVDATSDAADSGGTAETELQLVLVRSGTFAMGSPDNEADRASDETQHSVTISSDFWLGKYEVTQSEWRSLMGNNPSHYSNCGGDCPVEQVNWFEAVVFANAVSRSEGLGECYTLSGCSDIATGDGITCSSVWFDGLECDGYRLPTEAEWEYAARAESSTAWYCGLNESCVDAVAWTSSNADGQTHRTGEKDANDWDLYDMSGNVWEWTWDWYGDYSSGPLTDPTGSASGQNRVLRGGSWSGGALTVRSANRFYNDPGIRHNFVGFRLARTAP